MPVAEITFVIPREGVESSNVTRIGVVSDGVIPREGVESIFAGTNDGKFGFAIKVIPREGVERIQNLPKERLNVIDP